MLIVPVPLTEKFVAVMSGVVGLPKAPRSSASVSWSAARAPSVKEDMFTMPFEVPTVTPRVAPLPTLKGPPPVGPVHTINSEPVLVTSVRPR